MYLERLLQINMATLAALGTMLLGMGQRDPTTPLLVLIVAITSVWLTDFTGWFQLNRTMASVAALAAVVFSLRDLSGLQEMTRLFFIARVVVYLQVILLLRRKDSWVYWQLAVVSLLQVVVAAAFNQGVWFGVLLIVYLMVGLSGLALFFLQRERLRYQPGPLPAEPRPVKGARWPLAAQPSAFSGSATAARGGPGRELYRRLGTMGVATLLLTVLLFFTVPRIGATAWRAATLKPRATVGFRDRIELGRLYDIMRNDSEVMRVQFVEEKTGSLYPVHGSIYVRGAVLTKYDHGAWQPQATDQDSAPDLEPLPVTDLWPREGMVRQEITIEPLDRNELFCVWPFVNTRLADGLRWDPVRERLLRPASARGKRYQFALDTTAFQGGAQVPLTPPAPAAKTVETRPLLEMPQRDGRCAVPALVALADRWMAGSGLPPEDLAGRARALERRLRDSGDFQYSSQGQNRDLAIDPIEDFITNHPRGHCEYFATALALMLRSQGIPARVVVGYHCDEFNRVGRFFQVRQSHAHAWVEAYLEPRHLPAALLHGPKHWEWADGGWLRLDATPGGPGDRATADASWLARAGRSLGWLQSLWGNYVMEMDRSRQREAIYQPVLDWCKETGKRLSDPAWWRDTLSGLGRGIWQFVLDWIGGDWLSWRGLSALVVFGLILAAVGRVVLWLLRKLLRRLAARAGRTARAQRARVEFYRRLEAVLARQGLVRAASQTQHEFTLAAGVTIARATGRDRLAPLPVRVADAFYRVRFGGTPLDNRQAEEVEQALTELEQAAAQKG